MDRKWYSNYGLDIDISNAKRCHAQSQITRFPYMAGYISSPMLIMILQNSKATHSNVVVAASSDRQHIRCDQVKRSIHMIIYWHISFQQGRERTE